MVAYAVGEAEHVAELVDPVQKAMLRERIDGERERAAVAVTADDRDALRPEIDAEPRLWGPLERDDDALVRGGVQSDREEAVLQRVLREDVGERSRDDD